MIIPRRKPYFAPRLLLKVFDSLLKSNYSNCTQKLEGDISKILGIQNPIILSSGRIGLSLILKHSNLKQGSEIIMPSYTFGPLVKVIKDLGFIPHPVDINPKNFQMSPLEVKKAINKRTGAILATHLFGEFCEIKEIVTIAKKNKILLIEDCAQAIGATKNNKPAGSFGDISLSSFNIAKPLQGISGGIVFGRDKKIIKKIRNDVLVSSYDNKIVVKDTVRGLVGYYLSQTIFWYLLMYIFSFKKIQDFFVRFYRSFETKKTVGLQINPILSMIISENLIGYKKRLMRRRYIRSRYIKKLNKYIEFQSIEKDEEGTVDMLVAKINCDVYKLRRYLAVRGIDIAILDEIADLNLGSNYPEAKYLYNYSISLPLYESLTNHDINHVSKSIINFLNLQ